MFTSPVTLYKQAYSGLSRNSWYLSLVMLVNRSGTMVVPFLTIYCVRQLHFSVVDAGYIMALFGAGALSGAFLGGKLTDRFGFYDLQIGALVTGGLFFIILGFQHTFISMAVGTFLLSFCNESFRPANSTAIAHYSTAENKTRSFSLNRLAVNLGWSVGGAVGGLLASINYHLLFWVDGCTNIIAAVILLIVIPRSKVLQTITIKAKGAKTASAYQDTIYVFFILLSVCFGIFFFQFFFIEPVFLKTVWHFNERLIGLLMALNGLLIALVEMVLIYNLDGKRHVLTYISIGILVTGAGFVLLNVLPGHPLSALIIVIFVTLGEMLSMPFMNTFWILRTTDNNRGEYAALYSMSWSASQIISPAIGGQVILFGGFRLLWWAMGALSLLTAIGYTVIYRIIYQPKAYDTSINS
jgi:predicted MFS family arabinose efflux permease